MDIVTRRARQIRDALELTLLDVYQATGIKPDRLSRFETDPNRLMRYDSLQKLARFYSRKSQRKVTIDELLISDNGKESA